MASTPTPLDRALAKDDVGDLDRQPVARAARVGQALAWIAVGANITVSALLVLEIDHQRGLTLIWGLGTSMVAIAGAAIRMTQVRIAAGATLAIFAFLAGFSIGTAFAPGALLMLAAATFPEHRPEPWFDRFAGVVLVPIACVSAVLSLGLGSTGLVAFMIAAVAVMVPRRGIKAVGWGALAVLATSSAFITYSIARI